VDWPGAQPRDQLEAEPIQRRGGRPGRRVEDRRPVVGKSEAAEDGAPINGSVDEAVDLRHADQPNRLAVRIQGARREAIAQTALVDEEEAVPRVQASGWRVEAVLSAHAVKHLDAAGRVEQTRP